MLTSQELAQLVDPDGKKTQAGGGRYKVRCPAHDDRNPSMTVWVDDKGKAALNCFAGCPQDAIVAALAPHTQETIENTWRSPPVTVLIPRRRHTPTQPTKPASPNVESEHPYLNNRGEIAYVVRRFAGKKIRQYHQQNGRLATGRGDHPLIPYRLPDVLAAKTAGDVVYVVEGEKDADTLAQHGLTATTNAMGVHKWKPELNQWFTGADIIILPDNDTPGREHAQEVHQHLTEVANTARIVTLPNLPDKGDVTDWLETHTVEELEALVHTAAQTDEPTHSFRLVPGGTFIHERDHGLVPVWGEDQEILWASGEPIVITAKPGVGKTTLAHQTLLRRIGLIKATLLGYPVEVDERPVVYIAADRPRQIARSLARMTTATDTHILNERLIIQEGYLPHMLDSRPETLLELAELTECGTIYIDSLKDVAAEIEKPAAATTVNAAIQAVIREGIEVVVLHHQRKAGTGNRKPKTIDDLYGGGQVAWGAGSVICLWGDPTDPTPELIHLKKPAEEVGPFRIEMDWEHGTVTRDKGSEIDPVTWVHEVTHHGGLTIARNYAIRLFGPTTGNEDKYKKRAKRLLDKQVENGFITSTMTDVDHQQTTIYRPIVEVPR